MKRRFGRETWSLGIADGWHGRHDPDCATIVAVPEVGALQISAFFNDSAVTDADLREFAAEHLEAGAISRKVTLGDFVGFTIAFGTKDEFWREWYLRNGGQMLFVTYNCDADQRGIEDEAVDEMLATLSAQGEHVA